MSWEHGISKNRISGLFAHEDKLGWQENHGIQNIGIEDSSVIVYKIQVVKVWENFITELYKGPNRPVNLEVEPEEEVDGNGEKPLYFAKWSGKCCQGGEG
jgi:hypothetical protein